MFKRGGVEVDATGYSQKDLEKLFAKLPDATARLEDETRKRLGK